MAGAAAWASPTYHAATEPAELRVDLPSAPAEPILTDTAIDLIEDTAPAESPIVAAEIRRGVESLNGDVLSSEKRRWAWNTHQYREFGDVGAELLDSWPTYVASTDEDWIEMTAGGNAAAPTEAARIGLWNAAAVVDLRNYPEIVPAASVIPLPGALGTGLVTLGMIGAWFAGKRLLLAGRRA